MLSTLAPLRPANPVTQITLSEGAVMAKWAATTDIIIDKGFGGSREGRRIEGAVIHHVGGTDGRNYVANSNARNSHPTYHVNRSSNVAGIVHPDRRPYSTAHSVDRVAVTLEVDNDRVGGSTENPANWTISDKSLAAVIDVCLDHMNQEGLKKAARNTPGRDQPGVFFIAWHSQYKQTACPGPYILSKIDYIVDELNRRAAGGKPQAPSKPAAAPAEKPTPKSWEATAFGIGTTATKSQWKTIQSWLRKLGRYDGPADGVPGRETWKGIQRTVTRYGYYSGPIDGEPGVNTAKGMQKYAARGGGYTGPIDGVLGQNSWAGFVKRLSS